MTMRRESSESRFDPYDLPVEEYWGLVQTVNQRTLENYSDLFSAVTMDLHQAVVLVGSDGKRERHSQSKTEFVILTERPDVHEAAHILTDKLLEGEFPIHFELGPDGRIEVKCLSDDACLSYAYGDPNRVYPDRSLNSTRVTGSEETFRKARVHVLAEMTSGNEISGRIQERMREQLRQHRQTMRTGQYRGVPVFSPEIAVQYYDEHPPYRYGFKMGFLRAVQRKLDLLTVRMVESSRGTIDGLAERLPVTTPDRIGFFTQSGMIPRDLEEPLCEAYLWFLREYHRIQERYKNTQRAVETTFPRSIMQEHGRVIHEFVMNKE